MTDVDVLVPVMHRPQNAAPFMESLRASGADVHVWAIVNHEDPDTCKAWIDAGGFVLETDTVTFAAKVNYAYRHTNSPWIFLVGDDVAFHPGWLATALAAAGSQYNVIGTNDLGTMRVQRGEHATHMLVRRSYIDTVGASWDGPGVVCHEGFAHWYVDDEIVTAAKQRHVWVSATTSIVEHRHPYFGKATMDDVYVLGQANAQRDWVVFADRKRQFAH